MLDALLSARRRLYISWAGRHVRDNSVQPPSVLVPQLRDYLAQGWQGEGGGSLLISGTQQHPLQPQPPLFPNRPGPSTFAREWYGAYAQSEAQAVPVVCSSPTPTSR